jgi:hypothetical protein
VPFLPSGVFVKPNTLAMAQNIENSMYKKS